jgi:hypothetical protein
MSPSIVKAQLARPLQVEIGSGSALPDEIQWMPPGKHTVRPTVDGKPKEISLEVTQELAGKFAGQLAELRKAADEGRGDLPYLDFNHEDGAAAAEVTGLRWAGDDAKEGGIRAQVRWSAAGRAALEGRTFRRFSPQWYTDKRSGAPVGIDVNLGGLVNRAAFRTIQPVVAKRDDTHAPVMDETLKTELTQLLTAALAPINTRLSELETKAKATADAITPITEITNRVKALETSRTEGVLTAAKAKVAAWAAEGRIPAQDTAAHEALAKAIADNPVLETTMAKLPVNPAFKTVTNGSGAGGSGDPIDTFPKALEAELKAGAKTKSEAMDLAMAKHGELYRNWVKAGGKL